MKKLLSLALLLVVTACGGHETLSTPFNFRGKGINLFGSDSAPAAQGQSNMFEIVVNAPAGTTAMAAQNLFDAEARKVCGGKNYSQQITSTGTAHIREYGVKGATTSSFDTLAPSLKGFVTCQG